MKIVRGFSSIYYFRDHHGDWRVKPLFFMDFNRVAKGAFPDDLKARTLVMLSRNSPLYVKQLEPDERRREDACYRDCVAAWRADGYESDDYGRDYDETDFGDRTHLTATGGRKLALEVATKVQDIAGKLGYLNGAFPRP
jgi:hypothetical protein